MPFFEFGRRVAAVGDAEGIAVERGARGPEDLADFGRRPEVVLSFHPFGIGVERRRVRALRGGHLPLEPGDDRERRLAIARLAESVRRVGINGEELSVVVEHLLEVRNEPLGVDGIAVESSTHLVEDAAVLHRVERLSEHGGGAAVASTGEIRERPVRRELRGAGESAVESVEAPGEIVLERPGETSVERRRILLRGRSHRVADGRRDLFPLFPRLLAMILPVFREARQETSHADPAVNVVGREVRPREEGEAVRRENRGQGPPAGAREQLAGGHVNVVDVGALFPVDLDRHEVAVHQGGDGSVFERLPFHDVAPVAGRVTDREEDRFPLAPRLFEGLVPPGIPVDGVVLVLEQIGARFSGEPVRVLGLGVRASVVSHRREG